MADKDKLLIRKFMKEISDNISQNELESLKYLCGIESSVDASITKAYQVFDILEKRGILYNSVYNAKSARGLFEDVPTCFTRYSNNH